jgi:hypothetical protein
MARISKNRILSLTHVLKKLGAVRVVITYDGAGDSGQIDSVELEDKDGKSIQIPEDMMVEVISYSGTYTPQGFEEKSEVCNVKLVDALDGFCCDHLQDNGIDWYNNDGGFGKQIIDVEKATAKLEHNMRVTSTEYEEFEV